MKPADAANGAQGGGAVLQAASSIVGGLAANASGKYTRKVMRANAQNTRYDAMEEGERIRTAARNAMGRQLVAQGGSGFAVGTGSALDALRESAIEREIDLATVRRRSTIKAEGYEQQGEIARAQGKSAMIGGFISGAASLMDAASSAFGGGA